MTAGIDVDPVELKATADDFNINGLKRLDAAVTSVLTSASHVVLYQLKEDLNTWDRCDIEGVLFLVQLDTEHESNPDSVCYRLFIINRKSPDNYVDDILIGNKEMDYSEKMIMYCNSKRATVGIWFYDQKEADQVHTLLRNIVGGDSALPPSSAVSASISAPTTSPGPKNSSESVPVPTSTPSIPPVSAPAATTAGPTHYTHSRPKRPPRRFAKPSNQTFTSDRRDNQTGQNSRSRREPRRDVRSSLPSSAAKPNGTTSGGSHSTSSRRDNYGPKRSSNAGSSHTPQSSNGKPVLPSAKTQSSKPSFGKAQSSTKNNPSSKVVKSHAATKPKVDDNLARFFPDLSISEGSTGATLPDDTPESAIFESDAVSTMIRAPVSSALPSDSTVSLDKTNTKSVSAVPMSPAVDQAIIAAAAPIQPSDEPIPPASSPAPSVSEAPPNDSKLPPAQEKEGHLVEQTKAPNLSEDEHKTHSVGTDDAVQVVDISPKVTTEPELVVVQDGTSIRDTKLSKNTKRVNKFDKHQGVLRVEGQGQPYTKHNETRFKNREDHGFVDAKKNEAPAERTEYVEHTEPGVNIVNMDGDHETPMVQGPPLVGLPHGSGIGGGVGMGMGMMGMGMGMGVGVGMGMPPRVTMGMDDNGMPLPMMGGMGIPHNVHPMGAGGTFGGIHPQMAMVMHQHQQQQQQQHNMMMMHHIMQQRHMQQMHSVPSPGSSPGNVRVAPGVMQPPQLVRPALNIPPGSAPPPGSIPPLGMPPSSMVGHPVEGAHHIAMSEPGTSVSGNHVDEADVSVEDRMAYSVAQAHKNGFTGTNPNASLDRSAFRAVVQRMLTDRKLFDRVYEHFIHNVRER